MYDINFLKIISFKKEHNRGKVIFREKQNIEKELEKL